MTQATADTGNVDVALGVEKGKVVLIYQQPVKHVTFEPQNAFELAEHMARAAYEARSGKKPSLRENERYLAKEIRARVKEDLYERMVTRATLTLRGLYENKQPIETIARELVQTVLSQAT